MAAKQILRMGVALLGLRITLDQVLALGWRPLAMVVLSVAPVSYTHLDVYKRQLM